MKILKINADQPQQVMEGWGTSLCWWANAAGGWTMKGESGQSKREELMRLIFSENGLDFNIARYNIGGGDNPAEQQHMFHFRGLPCFQATEDSVFDKTADWRQLWVLQRAREIRDGDLITEVFVNSPPWWMTNSLCSAGNTQGSDENLSPSRYGEFVNYCVRVLDYLTGDCGIPVQYFSPMNEPASDYWGKGQRQEGNKVYPGEHQSRLLETAYRKLRETHPEIAVTGTDETNPTTALASFRMLSDEVKEDILQKINYHHYAEDDSALAELCQLAYADGFDCPRYRLWMDEVCYGDGKDSFEVAQKLCQAIWKDLNRAHASAWVIWQAMDTMSENIINESHWGLIEGMYQDKNNNELEGVLDVAGMGFDYGDYFLTPQYYVMGHYSKYIKPGYSLLPNDGDSYLCVSALSPSGNTLVAILCNEREEEQTVGIDLGGFHPQSLERLVTDSAVQWEQEAVQEDLRKVTLRPKSVTTLRWKR